MANRKSSDKSSAVAELRDRMQLIIQYIESVQDFPAGRQLSAFIDAEAAKSNLRALRLLSREVDAMTNTLESHERDELHALLKLRLGIDDECERAQLDRWARAVIERGEIRSEKERRRLENYAEMLTATGADPAQVQAINSLLQSG